MQRVELGKLGSLPSKVHGRFQPIIRNLSMTFDFGYLCGLVLGDGYLFRTKNGNYRVGLETTDEELATIFVDITRKMGFNPLLYRRSKNRSFATGQVYSNESCAITINSKQLYDLLRPFKKEDSFWDIPSFLFENEEAITGFLSGIFDAEGTVQMGESGCSNGKIGISSKHKENLEQVRALLERSGLKAKIYPYTKPILVISRYSDKSLFYSKIGFRLKRKNQRLSKMLSLYPKRYWTSKELMFLRDCYKTMSTLELSSKIGRTVISLYHKASRLGIVKC